jgi:O-methyltransferase
MFVSNPKIDGKSSSRLSSQALAVRNERLTYLSVEKLLRLEKTIRQVLDRDVPGDILEFGVALGGSAIVLAKYGVDAGRKFHGFDIFGLIPEPASEKDDQKSKDRYKIIVAGQSKGIGGDKYYGYRADLFSEVCASFGRHGVPVDNVNVVLYKGLFEKTWENYTGRSVAFAHIDCDWYEPVKFCLNSLVGKLASGGAIVLDDYNDYGGCRTAAHEFLHLRGEVTLEAGETAIVRRK